MTAIASTSHYTAGSYASASRSSTASADTAYADLPDDQETETFAAKASSASGDNSLTVDSRPSTGTLNLQSRLLSLNRIDISSLKATPTWDMPDDFYQSVVSGMQMSLEANYHVMPEEPDLANDPRTGAYATVIAGGKIVATIDNQGVVGSDSALGAKLQDQLLGSVNGTNGPNLAQARAEQIAKALGGSIVKSDTAISQSAFNALPSLKASKPTVDYEAMKNDPMYEQLEALKQKRADYLAQQG